MNHKGMGKLQYLLYALLTVALAGCGANQAGTVSGTAGEQGSVAAKLTYQASKTSAKAVALPASNTIVATVTGTGTDGKPIPVVRTAPATVSGTGSDSVSISGIYPGKVTLAVQVMNGSTVAFEGYAVGVDIAGGNNGTVNIAMTPPLVKDQDAPCVSCHETTLDATGQNLVGDFKQSTHYFGAAWTDNAKYGVIGTGCAGCHGPSHNDRDPAASGRCAECHGVTVGGNHHSTNYLPASSNLCSTCHNSHNPFGPFVGGDCLTCHSFTQNANARGSYVNDNSGVRAVTAEFSKNSHHVTGKTLTAADCAVCHLEGTAGGRLDVRYHMKDNKIHLRNGGGVAEYAGITEFVWDPASPNHTNMDKFCMSCHNANGAPAAVGIVAGNSASNPFNDTISNGYDQMSRSRVVGVYEQFDPANASHHAVRGQKYTTRASIPAAAFQGISSATNPTSIRKTMYEAGLFVSTYTPLGAAQTVADDSTLHCGDCHTVGQYKAGSTTDAMGNPTTAVIGAHGSANEYMLRNAYGSDALHHQEGFNGTTAAAQGFAGTVSAAGGNYVCYLCHTINKYGLNQRHNGIDNGNNCDGKETVGAVGINTVNGGTSDTLAATQAYRLNNPTASSGLGNVFGYSCAYCHNAGLKGFGGIHGSNTAFLAYSSNGSTGFALVSRKPYRFMPGLSIRYTGGATADKWEAKTLTSTKDGCYNLTTAADKGDGSHRIWGTDATTNGVGTTVSDQFNGTVNGSWGACGHHTGFDTSGPGTKPTRAISRPLVY